MGWLGYDPETEYDLHHRAKLLWTLFDLNYNGWVLYDLTNRGKTLTLCILMDSSFWLIQYTWDSLMYIPRGVRNF